MDFLKLGLEAVKVVYDVQRNSELAEANRERDKYKMKADNLTHQLNHMKNEKKTTGFGERSDYHRRSFPSSGLNSERGSQHQQGGGRNGNNLKSGVQDQYNPGRKVSVGPGGNGQGSVRNGQRSNSFCNNAVGSNKNDWKPKSNGSNLGSNRGEGSFTNRGRGRNSAYKK